MVNTFTYNVRGYVFKSSHVFCHGFVMSMTIRRLIRNFIWVGGDRSHVRAKVSWLTLTTPKQHGGLDIIDPMNQFIKLLVKVTIHDLLLGHAPWKRL